MQKECPMQRELPCGLIIEDLVKGDGKKAKKGRQVILYF
jgi:FKBP-type peptidyl-prolyl cis-trans isomerase